jgi:hypothetical protein
MLVRYISLFDANQTRRDPDSSKCNLSRHIVDNIIDRSDSSLAARRLACLAQNAGAKG